MVNATVRAVEGDVLVLSIGSEPLARRLSEARNTDVIADALQAVLGVQWRVRCDHGDAVPATPAGRPPSAPRRRDRLTSGVRHLRMEPRCRPSRHRTTPPDDEEAMLAEAAAGPTAPAVRRDPEEVAMELLSAQLGAKAIDRS